MGLDADRGWSRIRRIPGSIPGTAGSDCLPYFLEIFEEFGTCLGDMSDDFWMLFTHFRTVFRFVADMFGDALGTFWDHLG